MSRVGKKIAVFLAIALAWQGKSVLVSAAEQQYRMNIEVVVDGVEAGYIPAFDNNYENNLYVSLKGVAYALGVTEKAFVPVVERRRISIATGVQYPLQPPVWDPGELAVPGAASAARYALYVDDEARKYYSFILSRGGEYDAFLTPVTLALLFDLDIEVTDGRMEIRTDAPFFVSAEEMEEAGYMQGVNALVVGDGSTGEVFYGHDSEEAFPIASTTKLMTYLVFMDAVSSGECSLDGVAVISEKAAWLSKGTDGIVPMTEGMKVPVSELLYGMLLPSSNECALAIAEYTAGSQEAFVERMQKRAEEIGLENARFYNCHGLPAYDDQLIPAKVQNHMTAGEMFRLASLILELYPEVTEYTSAKEYYMESFGMTVRNTNAVLYNMENAVGLKTGTTNKAGACLVTCVTAEKDGETHYLITVLLGADGDADRGLVSEMAARYAMAVLKDMPERAPDEAKEEAEKGGIPEDPEEVVRELIGLLF